MLKYSLNPIKFDFILLYFLVILLGIVLLSIYLPLNKNILISYSGYSSFSSFSISSHLMLVDFDFSVSKFKLHFNSA